MLVVLCELRHVLGTAPNPDGMMRAMAIQSRQERHAVGRDASDDARAARIRDVLEVSLCRRATGEAVPDEDICAAHPDLLPELADELRTLRVIERARTSRNRRHTAVVCYATNGGLSVPADAFPGYELQHEIHRGGQGIIYRAIQSSTRRKVALKVLLDGAFAGPLDRARFEREISILAALRHQNIVAIHDSGSAAGRFYFVMDYIAGQPLDVYMSSEARSIEESLRLFLKICDAVNAAHVRGIIHRDLKPGNIRIGEHGEPYILDFGLARVADGAALDRDGDTPTMTLTGQFVGSLPWSAPEQVDGSPSRIDTRSDVYALGVLLYHMLTGKFPYRVVGPMHEVAQRIIDETPTAPRRLRAEIDDDLSTILMTCLAKQRERRYQTAGELGRDVERYLRGEPIEAKRDSAWYMLKKSLRRFRALLAVVTLFVAVLAASSVISLSLWRSAAEREAEARANLWESLVSQARTVRNTRTVGRRSLALEAVLHAAEIRRNLELRNEMIAALAITDAQSRTSPGFPDGMTIFDASFERCAVVDAALERVRIARVADGKTLAELPGLRRGSELHRGVLAGRYFARVFDESGGTRIAEVLRVSDGQRVLRVDDVPPRGGFDIAPNETTIAIARADQAIHIYDLATGEALRRIPLDRMPSRMAFDPTGRRLVLYHGAFERACILDLETEACTDAFKGSLIGWSVVWSPDGDLLVGAGMNEVHLWDVAKQAPAGVLRGHESMITHLAISPDGRCLVSRSWDSFSVVWDLVTHRALFELSGSFVAFSPTGSTIGGWTTVGADAPPTVRASFVEMPTDSVCRFISGRADPEILANNQPAFANQSPMLINAVTAESRPELGGFAVIDGVSGRETARDSGRAAHEVLFDEDDRHFVSFHPDLGLCRWPLEGSTDAPKIGSPISLMDIASCDVFIRARNGRVVAISERLGQATVVDLTKLDRPRRFECPPEMLVRAISSDGRLLFAAAWHGGTAAVWNTETAERVFDLPAIPGASGAFSPDDRLLITTDSSSMRVWDTSTWRLVRTLPGGYANPTFSRDGRFFATIVEGYRIRLFDVDTQSELCTLEPPERITTTGLDISADGTRLVQMSNRAGIGCVWDLARIRSALSRVGLDWSQP